MTFPEYIKKHLTMPFVWGENDCVLFGIGWLELKHGKDYLSQYKPWDSDVSAYRKLRAMGGLEAEFDRVLESINPLLAVDGDVTIHNKTIHLFSGRHIVGPGPDGLVFTDRKHACIAWRS